MASFPRSIVQQAWDRQHGLCAGCGKILVEGNQDKGEWGAWHPHHRKPRAYGGSDMLRNCVILCINAPERCHFKIGHGGDWEKRARLSDSDLPWLYGAEAGTGVTPIIPIGFPLVSGLSSRPKARRNPPKPRTRKPPPSIGIIRME